MGMSLDTVNVTTDFIHYGNGLILDIEFEILQLTFALLDCGS